MRLFPGWQFARNATKQQKRGHNRPFIGPAGVVPRLNTFHSPHIPQPQPAGAAACQQAVPSTQQHALANNTTKQSHALGTATLANVDQSSYNLSTPQLAQGMQLRPDQAAGGKVDCVRTDLSCVGFPGHEAASGVDVPRAHVPATGGAEQQGV